MDRREFLGTSLAVTTGATALSSAIPSSINPASSVWEEIDLTKDQVAHEGEGKGVYLLVRSRSDRSLQFSPRRPQSYLPLEGDEPVHEGSFPMCFPCREGDRWVRVSLLETTEMCESAMIERVKARMHHMVSRMAGFAKPCPYQLKFTHQFDVDDKRVFVDKAMAHPLILKFVDRATQRRWVGFVVLYGDAVRVTRRAAPSSLTTAHRGHSYVATPTRLPEYTQVAVNWAVDGRLVAFLYYPLDTPPEKIPSGPMTDEEFAAAFSLSSPHKPV